MSLCTPDEVRSIAEISTDEISDDELNSLITYAQKLIMGDLSSEVTEEQIKYIDTYRDNDFDGINKDFYTQRSWSRWNLFDRDGDGVLSTSDVKVYLYESDDDTRTEATISAVTESGKITLSTAPSDGTDKGTITYRYSPVGLSDPRLSTACVFLSAALAFTKIRADDFENISFSVVKVSLKKKSFEYYYEQYKNIIENIKRLPKKKEFS